MGQDSRWWGGGAPSLQGGLPSNARTETNRRGGECLLFSMNEENKLTIFFLFGTIKSTLLGEV